MFLKFFLNIFFLHKEPMNTAAEGSVSKTNTTPEQTKPQQHQTQQEAVSTRSFLRGTQQAEAIKDQLKIYTVNKLVDKLKEIWPGMTNLKVFFNFNYIKVSKIGLHYVKPLAIMINNRLIALDDLMEVAFNDFLFNIKESQYNYMAMRRNYLFWCFDIDASKQNEFKVSNFYAKYYESKLLYIADQKIINKIIPPAQEFTFDDFYFDEENEDVKEQEEENYIMSKEE